MNQIFTLLIMDLAAILTIVIAGVGLFGTLLGFVIKLAVNLGRYMQSLDKLIQDCKENEERNHEKFNDYYAFKYEVSGQLSKISENLQTIQEDMKEIKSDIKEQNKYEQRRKRINPGNERQGC